MGSSPLLFLFLSAAAAALISAAAATNFTCTTTSAHCQGLIEYVPVNSTTFSAASSLFQTPYLVILAANSLLLTTPSSTSVPAGSTLRIPFPCACRANGTGTSDGTPMYTVKPGDTLDDIARGTFSAVVTYQEIQIANGLPDPNKIQAGQKLWIPLPCSCDPVAGESGEVVHLGHVVAAGSNVSGIAAEFGTDAQTLLTLNRMSDPKKLEAGQLLDVPLHACSSSFSITSLDHNLLVPTGSSALTANNCVLCRCNSTQLDCSLTQGLSSSTCSAAKCGSLYIGNTSTSGCDVTSCAYGGYTSTTILATNTTQSTCSNGGTSKMGLKGSKWTELVIYFHMALLCFWLM